MRPLQVAGVSEWINTNGSTARRSTGMMTLATPAAATFANALAEERDRQRKSSIPKF